MLSWGPDELLQVIFIYILHVDIPSLVCLFKKSTLAYNIPPPRPLQGQPSLVRMSLVAFSSHWQRGLASQGDKKPQNGMRFKNHLLRFSQTSVRPAMWDDPAKPAAAHNHSSRLTTLLILVAFCSNSFYSTICWPLWVMKNIFISSAHLYLFGFFFPRIVFR